MDTRKYFRILLHIRGYINNYPFIFRNTRFDALLHFMAHKTKLHTMHQV